MASNLPNIAISIMGPTASGKTALALALARHLPVEIVNVDAAQVYRGLDIGTAKPTAEEQGGVPHHLIDIRDPAQSYSAAEFRADALQALDEIRARGRIPLLVGGTMFYFRALEFGLSALPTADPGVRARLFAEAQTLGLSSLHARLAALDPSAAARIHRNDPQRVVRALEIIELTGRTPSTLTDQAPPEPAPYHFLKIALAVDDRRALHERIALRFSKMLESGLVDEVARLRERADLGPHLPSIRTVGYRQIWEYLSGLYGYSEMANLAIAATRQLAKRQLTWLRRYPGLLAVPMASEPPVRKTLDFLRADSCWQREIAL